MAGVAVVDADLEFDTRGDLGRDPVGLAQPEPLGHEAVRLVEGGGAEHDMTEPLVLGPTRPPPMARRTVARRGEAVSNLDPYGPRRVDVHKPLDPASIGLIGGGVPDGAPGVLQAGHGCGPGVGVSGLEAQRGGIR